MFQKKLFSQQVYSMKVTDNEIFLILPKIGAQRIMFAYVTLLPHELKAIEEFNVFCEKHNHSFPWLYSLYVASMTIKTLC
jgi:hypothetical protein